MLKATNKIYNLLDRDDKKKFNFLIMLTFIAALLETIGLAAFIPIIEFFTGEQVVGFNNFLNILNLENLDKKNSIYFFILFLFLIFIIKNLFLACFYFYESRFIFQAKTNLINRIFKNYLFQNYSFHINNNSSKLISNLTIETDIFANSLSFLINIAVEMILLTIILTFIFYLNPILSILLLLFAIIYLLSVHKILKKRTQKIGGDRVEVDAKRQKTLQQSFDGIKEIIVFDNREFFVKYFNNLINEIRRFITKFTYINKIQKIFIEMFVIISMILFITFLVYNGYETAKITAYIGIYLLAIIKVIPSINKIVSAGNYLQYAAKSASILNDELKIKNQIFNETHSKDKIKFESNIKLQEVSFKYSKKMILDNVNIELKKNNFIGVVGNTGSGKSTLSNLLLGLFKPSLGKISSDGQDIFKNIKSYQSLIGYVPQNIFLLDDTIKNNIAFGVEKEKISDQKILEVIKLSSLEKFIDKLPNKINQFVGEKGVRISGGEKQRIGIARALFRNPSILILDEPTSALDSDTELKIINELLLLKKNTTVFLITHKAENLKEADQIFKVENSKLYKIK